MCNKMRAYLQRECAPAYLVEPCARLSGRACLDEPRARLSGRASRLLHGQARGKHLFSLPWRLSLDKHELFTRAVPLKQDLPNTCF